MIRIFLVLCILLFTAGQTESQNNPILEVEQSLVKIVIQLPDDKLISVGTGFFVGDEHTIATASHVYFDAGKSLAESKGKGMFVYKSSKSGQKFVVPITIMRTDPQHDLATFYIDPEAIKGQWKGFEIKPLKLADSVPEIGEEVCVLGYFGQDEFPLASRGIVSGNTPQEDMLLDLRINLGQSGSPVFSPRTKEVIAVLSGFVPTPIVGTNQQVNSGLARATKVYHLKAIIGQR